MALALIVLAVGSVLAGYIGVPQAIGGHNALASWLAPAFQAQTAGSNALIESSLAYACGVAGDRSEALEILNRLTEGGRYVPHWFLSLIWIGIGDADRAFEHLETAFDDREPCMVTLGVDPIFDPLRADDRFDDLVRRIAPASSKQCVPEA